MFQSYIISICRNVNVPIAQNAQLSDLCTANMKLCKAIVKRIIAKFSPTVSSKLTITSISSEGLRSSPFKMKNSPLDCLHGCNIYDKRSFIKHCILKESLIYFFLLQICTKGISLSPFLLNYIRCALQMYLLLFIFPVQDDITIFTALNFLSKTNKQGQSRPGT